jgi:hypothetical protein
MYLLHRRAIDDEYDEHCQSATDPKMNVKKIKPGSWKFLLVLNLLGTWLWKN